jgi:hypothetical protein
MDKRWHLSLLSRSINMTTEERDTIPPVFAMTDEQLERFMPLLEAMFDRTHQDYLDDQQRREQKQQESSTDWHAHADRVEATNRTIIEELQRIRQLLEAEDARKRGIRR